MNSLELFKARLGRHLKIDLELVLNENRSTMLNLLEKSRYKARLSVHKMFLQAPDPVISAIAHYVRGTRKEAQILREFIQKHLSEYDYTHLIDQKKLIQEGKVYNLRALYDAINEKYFEKQLNLSITWCGKPKPNCRWRITFGQYLSGLKLIKMHRILDDLFFPHYFVEFVVYHEMLHSVIPGALDGRGRYCFHSSDFKMREKAFEHYQRAIDWEKNNKEKLFKYGWT